MAKCSGIRLSKAGATPQIISLSIFHRAEVILNNPERRLLGQPTQRYRLRGHIRCLTCGTPMVGQSLSGGRYRYYRCRRTYASTFEGKCPSKYVKVDILERAVLEEIAQLLSEPERILHEAGHFNQQGIDRSRQDQVTQELKLIEVKQRRLTKLYVDGSIPDHILSLESRPLNQKREWLEAELRGLQETNKEEIDLSHLQGDLSKVAAKLREWVLNASDEDLELILKALSVQVKVSNEQAFRNWTQATFRTKAIYIVIARVRNTFAEPYDAYSPLLA